MQSEQFIFGISNPILPYGSKNECSLSLIFYTWGNLKGLRH